MNFAIVAQTPRRHGENTWVRWGTGINEKGWEVALWDHDIWRMAGLGPSVPEREIKEVGPNVQPPDIHISVDHSRDGYTARLAWRRNPDGSIEILDEQIAGLP